MPKQIRSRQVSLQQARAYLGKAEDSAEVDMAGPRAVALEQGVWRPAVLTALATVFACGVGSLLSV